LQRASSGQFRSVTYLLRNVELLKTTTPGEFKSVQVFWRTATLKLLRRETPEYITAPNLWLLMLTSVLLIAESWQCYRSGYVNILYKTLISWGNVWLTDRRSLIKRLIGGDLGW